MSQSCTSEVVDRVIDRGSEPVCAIQRWKRTDVINWYVDSSSDAETLVKEVAEVRVSANSHAGPLTNFSTLSMISQRRTPLCIPELLLESFRLLPSNALQVAALVCKIWSPIAVDVLWREREVPLDHLLRQFLPECADLPESVRQNMETELLSPTTETRNTLGLS